MKVLQIKVLSGPNYWSNYRKQLIVMKINLEDLEDYPTNLLDGFTANLKKLIPSLYQHRCSIGVEGGFFQRLEKGTWLGHVIEHIALELQTLAGMDCGFGRTFSAKNKGEYQVIFTYRIANAGIYAAKAAVAIVEHLAERKEYNNLASDIDNLRTMYMKEKLGPSTEALVEEAKKRKIPVFKQNAVSSLVTLGYGVNQKKLWATVSSSTSSISVDLASDKELTKQILNKNFIPVPQGVLLHNLDELDHAIKALGFPLVIKPVNGNHGRGITSNINNQERALTSFLLAKTISKKIIVERYINGLDYRFLVVNFKVVAVAQRTPACIVGQNEKTIAQLIHETNQDPLRGKGHSNYLSTIVIDDSTLSLLIEKNLSLDSILKEGEVLYLKDAANLSTGGTATDVSEKVHPANIELAERVAKLIGLDICGIDIIASDIQNPINGNNGAVIEVNAGPGLRMHLAPTLGKPKNVAGPIIDMLFPKNNSWKIPLIAVTGTNGKTTVVRLIAHLAQQKGHHVGITTTDGIYINGELINAGDCSGPISAQYILQEPNVDFAVLECARGGILREGLGFDHCDISIVTNVTSDHLGLNGISTLEELCRVKSVVAQSTHKNGYAILNAEDDLVFNMKANLSCKIALFSLEKSQRIQTHFESGGLGIYTNNDFIVLFNNNREEIVARLDEFPLTFNGAASLMIQNLLPSILAGIISGFTLADITKGLLEFIPSADMTPGRMNLFNGKSFKIMLDYAHNEGAYLAIGKYLETINASKKVGIISATGDRRSQDIEKLGTHSALIFDEIIIRHNSNGRGRSNEELTQLLMNGILQAKINPSVKVISNEFDAIKYAMDNAVKDTFIFCCVDDVLKIVEYTKKEINNYI
ncbi:MAG: cyanophycin synthetase [Tatlockia sp.]|nr:cyanophycin synthetase [Tatlockia sp.]